jgi:hypothetical protein
VANIVVNLAIDFLVAGVRGQVVAMFARLRKRRAS